jgi:membrane-associated phospholipid phosphatase
MSKRFFLLLALPFLFSPFDIQVSSIFFKEGEFSNHPFFTFIYTYGEYPALATVGFSAFLIPFTYLFASLKSYRLPLFFLAFNLVLGGFLINEKIFKEHFGRPRPKQTTLFGGEHPFRPLHKPDISFSIRPLKSFACGHATAGFYFFSVARLQRTKKGRYFWILFALLTGSLLGIARIAQGGHFLSDVLTSLFIMWGSSSFLDYFLLKKDYERTHTKTA